jgi:hypothetical protein
MWFGLLFFAAITSSLAMGQPIMAFLQNEFKVSRERSAVLLCALLLPLALPVAMLHDSTFFDEFDFWAGTFALVVLALGETILFAWVFGMDRGWAEIMLGAQLKVPRFFYYVIKYVTPTFLLLILTASAFTPKAGWEAYIKAAFGGAPAPAWEWSGGSLVGKLLHLDIPLKDGATPEEADFNSKQKLVRTIDRIVMVGVFLFFCALVFIAVRRRRADGGHEFGREPPPPEGT